MMRQRYRQDHQPSEEIATSSAALDPGVHALERHVVDVDDRQAVEILETGPQRDELQQVRHDLHVDALAAGELDQTEQLDVLLGRESDVEVIDLLAAARCAPTSLERAEQRQPAEPRPPYGRGVIDEPDHLIAELAMLQDAVGDHAAELAGAGDENRA